MPLIFFVYGVFLFLFLFGYTPIIMLSFRYKMLCFFIIVLLGFFSYDFYVNKIVVNLFFLAAILWLLIWSFRISKLSIDSIILILFFSIFYFQLLSANQNLAIGYNDQILKFLIILLILFLFSSDFKKSLSKFLCLLICLTLVSSYSLYNSLDIFYLDFTFLLEVLVYYLMFHFIKESFMFRRWFFYEKKVFFNSDFFCF